MGRSHVASGSGLHLFAELQLKKILHDAIIGTTVDPINCY